MPDIPPIGVQMTAGPDDTHVSEQPDQTFGRPYAHPPQRRRERVTLDPTRIIPGGVAKRLARIYDGVDYIAIARGEIGPVLEDAAQRLHAAGHSRGVDQHAARADCCALADYFEAYPQIDPGEPESADVVPWSYCTYRGRPQARSAA